MREQALADDKVRPWLDGRGSRRWWSCPGRLVNIVTRAEPAPRVRALGLVLAALLLARLRLQHSRGNLPDHIKTVAVPDLQEPDPRARGGERDHLGRGQRLLEQRAG